LIFGEIIVVVKIISSKYVHRALTVRMKDRVLHVKTCGNKVKKSKSIPVEGPGVK
jgi:hypothetical protein